MSMTAPHFNGTAIMRYVLPSSQWLPPAVLGGCLPQFYQVEMPLLKIVDLQIPSQLPMMP
jgi:hypothetical protein